MRGPTRPFSFIRTLTVGFGVAPNLLTLLLEGSRTGFREKEALAGLGYLTLTAGGEFHPALRTSAARDERPRGSMAKGGRASKNLAHGQGACPHDQINDWGRPSPARGTRIRRAGLGRRESDSGLFSWQKLTRVKSCGRAALWLWMDSARRCADSANHIT